MRPRRSSRSSRPTRFGQVTVAEMRWPEYYTGRRVVDSRQRGRWYVLLLRDDNRARKPWAVALVRGTNAGNVGSVLNVNMTEPEALAAWDFGQESLLYLVD